jgi:methionine-gamma-lyase
MEGTETATVTSSGMGAITAVLFQLCGQGDHILSSRTIYGGTYAFLKNFAPRMGLSTTFVDITNLEKVEASITEKTKVLYCESVSNPLLEVANIKALSGLARKYGLQLVVDNTFSPLSIAPVQLGADVVIHSLTKFINGSSDTVGGVICGSQEFIDQLRNVNEGAAMLLGSTMDSLRAASILKNLRTLHIRMQQHSKNALFLAKQFESVGLKTVYPGLRAHPSHELFRSMMHPDYGYGGMLTIDVGSLEKANELMELMQKENLGYLAVSLGFYKTLFSAPGTSTSSEIPEEEQIEMGLSDGLIRFSIGLDADIDRTFAKMKECMMRLGIIQENVLA